MSRDPNKRASGLLERTSKVAPSAAPTTPSAGPVHGAPGLLSQFARADKASLDRLATLEAKYAGGDALPCLMLDPASIATGRFFNRFKDAFEPANDAAFAALLEDIRSVKGNTVAGLVRSTPEAALPYELVYGERRLRACAQAGVLFKTEIGSFSDEEIALLHARENRHRENPSAVESAMQLDSWFKLLGSAVWGEGEISDRVGMIFGYSGRHALRLRRIATIPTDVLGSIPGIRMISVRQALTLADAWKADARAVRQRLSRLTEMPGLLPKQVVAFLSADEQSAKNTAKVGSREISIQWPTDAEKASALRARLREVEKEFGIRLGLPK